MRRLLDRNGRVATVRRPGRLKNPSVRTAEAPSSISSVVTPAQVTVTSLVAVAAGVSR